MYIHREERHLNTIHLFHMRYLCGKSINGHQLAIFTNEQLDGNFRLLQCLNQKKAFALRGLL